MSRNLSCPALVLRARASGESNREVWLLGAETGLVRATVFGGPKSRLRACASPFHSGRAWIYHDPVKDTRKLSDFDALAWRPGLREMYDRVMAADAVAQTVLESRGGGGDWPCALALSESALDALAGADCDACRRVLVWFLWQWAGFLGVRPDISRCSACSSPAPAGASLWFSPREGSMACAACARSGFGAAGSAGAHGGSLGGAFGGGLSEAGASCRQWLESAARLPPSQIALSAADEKSARQAKALATAALSCALGRRLAGWDW